MMEAAFLGDRRRLNLGSGHLSAQAWASPGRLEPVPRELAVNLVHDDGRPMWVPDVLLTLAGHE
jgi:hypothetical protein